MRSVYHGGQHKRKDRSTHTLTENAVEINRNVVLDVVAPQRRVRVVRSASNGILDETSRVVPAALSTRRELRVQLCALILCQRGRKGGVVSREVVCGLRQYHFRSQAI